MARKRKEIPSYMVDTINAYKSSGRILIVFPFAGMMALNGFPQVCYQEAYKQMRSALYPTCDTNSDRYCQACKKYREDSQI